MARRFRRLEVRLQGRAARVAAIAFGVLLLAAGIVGCVVYHSETTPELPLPRPQAQPLAALERIEGWVPYWTDEAAVAQEAARAGFTDLLFFHGTVDEHGGVKLENPARLEKGRTTAVLNAVRTWLTVTNHGKSLEGALADDRLQSHADNVIAAFQQSRCQHLDLDYESLTGAQARNLPALARLLAQRLDYGTRLSFTLQPVDNVHRPGQAAMIRELLAMDAVYTVRFMMYDYHWSGSLPGALCDMASYQRLLDFWAGHTGKLTMCLPLYGYDWPRPEDTTLPRAKSVTLRDVPRLARQPGFQAAWMDREGELAARYGSAPAQYVALPSFRAVTLRVEAALDAGVPAASFWHLGCGRLSDVKRAAERGAGVPEPVQATKLESWDDWMEPFKRRVCTVVRGDGRTLEDYAQAYGVSRAEVYRFNTHIARDTAGREIFIPRK